MQTDWYGLSEEDFLLLLESRLKSDARLGSVFPFMVSYNVPLFFLKKLWPEKFNYVKENRLLSSFAVSEKNWKGNSYNIQSEIFKTEKNYKLGFQKSYVMQAQKIFLLAKYKNDFALVNFPCKSAFQNPEQYQKRPENFNTFNTDVFTNKDFLDTDYPFCFEKDDSALLYHYEMKGDINITENDFIIVAKKKYLFLSLQIMRRELSSLAFLTRAFFSYYHLEESSVFKQLEDDYNLILNLRNKGSLHKSIVSLSYKILKSFSDMAEEKKIKLHPLYKEAGKRFLAS